MVIGSPSATSSLDKLCRHVVVGPHAPGFNLSMGVCAYLCSSLTQATAMPRVITTGLAIMRAIAVRHESARHESDILLSVKSCKRTQ